MVTGKFQHAGVVNRNNRVYPRRCFEQQLAPNSELMRRVRERKVIGHLEHPEDGRTDLSKAAVLIADLRMNENGEVMGTLETLSTPAGQVASALFKDKVTVGISSRGRGSVNTRDDGVDEVQDDYVMETFDLVADPSTYGAELVAESEKKGDKKLQLVLCESVRNPNAPELLAVRENSLLAEAKRIEDNPVEAFRFTSKGVSRSGHTVISAVASALSRSKLDYRIERLESEELSYVVYAANKQALVEAVKKGAVQAMNDHEVSSPIANAIQSALDGHKDTGVDIALMRTPELDPAALVRESLKAISTQKALNETVKPTPAAPAPVQERAAAVGTKNTTIRILFGSPADREKFVRAWTSPQTLFQSTADKLQVLIIGHQESDTGRMEQSVIDMLQQLGIYESARVEFPAVVDVKKPVSKLKEGYEIISTARKTIADVRYPDDATEADKADFVMALSKLSGIVGTLPRGDGNSLEVDLDGNRFDAAAAYEMVRTAIADFNRQGMKLDAKIDFTSRVVDLAVEFTGDMAEAERTSFVNTVETTPEVDSVEINGNQTVLHFDGDVFSEEDAKKIALSLLTQAGVQYESQKVQEAAPNADWVDKGLSYEYLRSATKVIPQGDSGSVVALLGWEIGRVRQFTAAEKLAAEKSKANFKVNQVGWYALGGHGMNGAELLAQGLASKEQAIEKVVRYAMSDAGHKKLYGESKNKKAKLSEGADGHTHEMGGAIGSNGTHTHRTGPAIGGSEGDVHYHETFTPIGDDAVHTHQTGPAIGYNPSGEHEHKTTEPKPFDLDGKDAHTHTALASYAAADAEPHEQGVSERAYPDDLRSSIVTVYFDNLREIPKFKTAIATVPIVTDVQQREIDSLEVWFAKGSGMADHRAAINSAASATGISVEESARINHVDRGPTMQVEFERTSDASQFERAVKLLDVETVHLTPRVMSVRFVDEITPQEAEAKIRGCLENCNLKSENIRVSPAMVFRPLKEMGIQAHANQVVSQRKVVATANSRASASVAARRLNAGKLPNFIKRVSVPADGSGSEIYFDIDSSVSDKDAINLVNDVLTRYELAETVKVLRAGESKRLERSCSRLHEAEIETFVCATVEVELEEMPLETREHFNVFRNGECLDLVMHEIQTALDAAEVDYDDLYAGWEDDNPDTFFVKVYAPVETDVGEIVAAIKEVLALEEVEVEETDEHTNTNTAVKALLVNEGKRLFMRFFDSTGARTVGPVSLRNKLRKFSERNGVPLWVSRTGDVLVLSKVKEAMDVLRKAASEISLTLEDTTTAHVIELIAPGVLSGPDDPIAPSAKANQASPYEAEADKTEEPNTQDKPTDDDYDVKVSEDADPNVPTGVNVIPKDGKFIVYSDGMDKMLAGPFDTEPEAQAALIAILDAPLQDEGGDYDVSVAGMALSSSVYEASTDIPPIALGPQRKPLQKGDIIWTYSQKTQQEYRWQVLNTPLPVLGNKVYAKSLTTGEQRDLMPGTWARNPSDIPELPFYAGMFDDRGMPIEWPLESKLREDSGNHFAFRGDTLYADTGVIRVAEKMSSGIDHMGFGDFTARGVKIAGGSYDVQFIRADGTSFGEKLKAAGFIGRPHEVSFSTGNSKALAQAFAKMLSAAGVVELSVNESGPQPPKPMRTEGAAVAAIRPGSRVTIRTPQGQERTGRAVMRSSEGGWVLNMGGKYGTPGLASDRNIVAVDSVRFEPVAEATEPARIEVLPGNTSDTRGKWFVTINNAPVKANPFDSKKEAFQYLKDEDLLPLWIKWRQWRREKYQLADPDLALVLGNPGKLPETDSSDVSAGSAEVAPIKKPDDEAGDGEIVKPNAKGVSPITPVIGGNLSSGESVFSTPQEAEKSLLKAVVTGAAKNDPMWLWSDERGSNTLRLLKSLKQQGYVTATQKDGKDFYTPTDAGKKYAAESVSEQVLQFDAWMKEVDRAVDRRMGMSVYDLPDMPFRDWYDAGKSTDAAAAKAISSAKNYESRVVESAEYANAISKAVLTVFTGMNLNPTIEKSAEDNGWVRFNMDAQEFPVEIRNKALDIIYGKSSPRDAANPQLGNVQPHSLVMTLAQWVLLLKEYNVTPPVMTEAASRALAEIAALKKQSESELRALRMSVMRKMREAKGAELAELKNQKVYVDAALNSKQFTEVMGQARVSAVTNALHPDEIVVLVATKSEKPFARTETAIKHTGINFGQYREAQQSLVGKGLLNANTALNDCGRAVLVELEKRGTIPKAAKLEHLTNLRDAVSQLEPSGEKRAMLFWSGKGESKPRFQAALSSPKDGKQSQWFNMANNGRGEAYVTLATDAELGRGQIEAFLRGVAPGAFVPHSQYSNVYVAKQLGESKLEEISGHKIVFVVQGTDGKWFVATATNDDYEQGLAQYKGVLSKDAALNLGKEMAARWGASVQVLKQTGTGKYALTNESVAADEDVAIEWDELDVAARNAALDAALMDNDFADSEWSDLPAKVQDKLYDFWKDYQTFESTRRIVRGSGKLKLKEGVEDKPTADQATLAKQMRLAGYEIGGGGTETPTMYRNKKWYLYVWQPRTSKHAYYDFADDVFISDTDFAKLNILPESAKPLKERLFLKPAGESLLRDLRKILSDDGWDTSAFNADEVRRIGFVASVKEIPPAFTASELDALKADDKAMAANKAKGLETPEAVMLAANAKRQEKIDAIQATFVKVRDAAKECNCADRAKLDMSTVPKDYVTLMVNFDTDMLVRTESCNRLHETLVQGSAQLVTSGTGKSLRVQFDDEASATDFLNKAFERFPYDIYGRNDKNNASSIVRDSNPNGSTMNWIVRVNLKNMAGFEPEYETKAYELATALLAMVGYRGAPKAVQESVGLQEGTKQTYHLFIRKPGAMWWTWQLHLPVNDAYMQKQVDQSKGRGYETAVRLVTIPDTGDLNAVMKAMGISGQGTIKNLPGTVVESTGKPNMSDRPTGVSMELPLDSMQEAEETARVLNTLPGVRAEAKALKEGAVVYATFQPEQYAVITKAIFKAARGGMAQAVESLKTENDKLKISNNTLQSENTRVLEENRILSQLNEEMSSLQHKAELKYMQDEIFRQHPVLQQFESEFDTCDTVDAMTSLAERMLRISVKKGLDENQPVIQNKPRSEDALVERGTKSPSGIPVPSQLENTEQGLSFTEAKAKGTATVPDTFGRLTAHRNQSNKK